MVVCVAQSAHRAPELAPIAAHSPPVASRAAHQPNILIEPRLIKRKETRRLTPKKGAPSAATLLCCPELCRTRGHRLGKGERLPQPTIKQACGFGIKVQPRRRMCTRLVQGGVSPAGCAHAHAARRDSANLDHDRALLARPRVVSDHQQTKVVDVSEHLW